MSKFIWTLSFPQHTIVILRFFWYFSTRTTVDPPLDTCSHVHPRVPTWSTGTLIFSQITLNYVGVIRYQQLN